MKVLMIGTGSIGRRHIRSLQQLESDLHWVFLRRSRQPDELSEQLGAVVVDRLGEALQLAPDLVVLATPSSLHIDCLPQLLASGLPLYIEKPLVTDRAQLERVHQAVAALDRPLPPILLGCNLRFLPSLRRLRDMVHTGALGRIIRADLQAGQWLPDWRPSQDYRQSYSASAALGGGVLLDLIHEIDAARWLLGEFSQSHAFLSHASSLGIESEQAACIILRQQQGTVASISLDYISRRPLRCYRIVGEQGTLLWDLPARRLELHSPAGVELLEADPAAFDVAATYPLAMQELLQAMRSGRQTAQPLSEGLLSTELLLHIKEHATV